MSNKKWYEIRDEVIENYNRDLHKWLAVTSTWIQSQSGANKSGTSNAYSASPMGEIKKLESKLRGIYTPHGIFGGYDGIGNFTFEIFEPSKPRRIMNGSYDEFIKVLSSAKDPQDEEQRLLDYFWGLLPASDTQSHQKTIAPEHCIHNWKLYNGFNEDYYYCTICDTKKPLENK